MRVEFAGCLDAALAWLLASMVPLNGNILKADLVPSIGLDDGNQIDVQQLASLLINLISSI